MTKHKNIALFLLLASATWCWQGCAKGPAEPDAPIEVKDLLSFSFPKDKNPGLAFTIGTQIKDDTIYARTFAGTDISKLVADFTHDGQDVAVNGVVQQSGVTQQDFRGMVKYVVRHASGGEHSYTVKFSDTGLPAFYLSTGGQEILDKENYVKGTYRVVRGFTGEALHEGDVDVRGRGNSTWNMPKKPYRLRLSTAAELLGMPSNRHWALMANYADRSLIRNDVAFEISRRLGLEYTPRQQYADFFLNGEYMGNYNVTEHIREGKQRVNIDEENGGYMLEADGFGYSEPVFFETPREMPITVKYPGDGDITAAQFDYIKDYFTAFEDALFADNFADPEAGYQRYLDLTTFVNYYLANEIAGNSDLYWSMRMYKKSASDPLIYTGPVWDVDLGFNNDNRIGDAVKKLMLTDAHAPKQWIARIAEDPNFRRAVRTRWNAVKADLATINQYVDRQANLLSYSQVGNFQRWDILQEPNIHFNWYVGNTYQDYVDFIKTYLTERIAWLDTVYNGSGFAD